MLILPRGITGFDVPKGHAEADPRSFRADCWEIVAPRRGRVEDRPQVPNARFTSFIAEVLVLSEGKVAALLNKLHPWVGFCRPPEPVDARLDFVDPGRLGDAFAALGRCRVLSRAELDQPVDESMCAELGPAELRQLDYWSRVIGRGQLRVGGVVFNSWD